MPRRLLRIPWIDRAHRGLIEILYREPWWAEWWAAWLAVGWAAWNCFVAAPLETRPSFEVAAGLAPDWVWQLTGFTIGAAQVVALLLNRRELRRLCCGLASWWWGLLVLSICVVDWHAPGLPLYAAQAGINLFSIARLRADRYALALGRA